MDHQNADVLMNGHLHFDDPYGDGSGVSDSFSHHMNKHHCQGESRRGFDQTSAGSQNSFEQQMQAQIQSLELQIQQLLAELAQQYSPSAGSSSDSNSLAASSSVESTQSVGTQAGNGDSTISNQAVTGSVGDSTTSTQAATGIVGDSTISTQSSTGASGDSTITNSSPATVATGSSASIDSIVAQSPNATGPLSLDSSVNNASVVGFVGPTAGAQVDRSAQVEFKDMKSYVHLKTGGWVQIEDQKNSEIIGGNWKDDMKGDSQSMTVQNGHNDAIMNAPPAGYVDHFWLHDGGGAVDPSKVDGFFSSAEAKASVPNSGLSASLGIDWFKADGTASGQFGSGTALTDQWQLLYHTTLDRRALANDPPPGLNLNASGTDSAVSSSTQTSDSSSNSATSTDSSVGTSSNAVKLINLFPQKDSDWQRIINDAPKGSLIVTASAADINPKYDLPFSSIDPSLKQHISDADAAGMKTLGYVGTANGTKPLAQAEAEIDDWYRTSDVRGIYLGNSGKADDSGYATDPQSEQYFETLANYIKSKGGMAVINGSGTPNPDYANYFDVQGTVENSAKNYNNFPEAAWQSNYSADRFSAVLGDVPLADLKQVESEMIAKNNGYIAVADTYPNPLTDQYWQAEIQYLKQS